MKRDPKAKPGELRAAWSTAKKRGYSRTFDERGDFVYAWGDGVPRRDSALLHWIFACKRHRAYVPPGESPLDASLLEELQRRGYDLTTLRFSIRKKATPTPEIPADEHPR